MFSLLKSTPAWKKYTTAGCDSFDWREWLFQVEPEYNAWEEDIAVVNIFFGKETIMGEIKLWNIILFFNGWLDYCLLIFLVLSLPKVNFSVEMERRIRMGPIEFISSLGGLFGLCLGFSFISFFEIVYWAIKALSRSFFSISIGTLSSRNNWRNTRKVWAVTQGK